MEQLGSWEELIANRGIFLELSLVAEGAVVHYSTYQSSIYFSGNYKESHLLIQNA